METLLNALPWIVGGLILILLLAALRRPLEWLVRLAARTGVGLAALWALSGVGPDWGRTHFVQLFVMRKAEEADGKYYYVGHVAAFDNPTLTTKPNAAGNGTVKVTLSTLRLARPLDPELYRHLVG